MLSFFITGGIYRIIVIVAGCMCLQCFDTVGWASGRASGL